MNYRTPVKETLKNMVKDEALSNEELRELQRLQLPVSASKKFFSSRWFYSVSGIAAGLLIIVFSSLLLTNSNSDIQERIAHEVLINHLYVKPLDVKTDSITALRAYMDRLNFNPKLSTNLPSKQAQLVGGRYCTLQGAIAAQLKLLLPTGEVMTYYEAAYDSQRFGKLPKAENNEQPILIKENGFTMRMWQESDLVMVTAQQAY